MKAIGGGWLSVRVTQREKGVCYNKLARSGPRFALSEDTTGDAADKAHRGRTKQGIRVTLVFQRDQADCADDQRHDA